MIYDSTDRDLVRGQIASFVNTYRIDLSELAQTDLTAYKVRLLSLAMNGLKALTLDDCMRVYVDV